MRKKNEHFRRGVCGLLAVLLVASIGATAIANTWASFIDKALGTSSVSVSGGGAEALYYESDYETYEQWREAREALSQSIEAEGIVLLENAGNALPLKKGAALSLFGGYSYNPFYGGQLASTNGALRLGKRTNQNYSLIEGLESEGFSVNPTLKAFYEEELKAGYGSSKLSSIFTTTDTQAVYFHNDVPKSEYVTAGIGAETYAGYQEAAIVTIGRPATEGSDFPIDYPTTEANPTGLWMQDEGAANAMAITDAERAAIEYAAACSDKVIVLLNTINAVQVGDVLTELKALNVQQYAILWIGLPNSLGFPAVAQVLNGTVNPSGRLTDTYPTLATSAPAVQNAGVFSFTNYDAYSDGANGAIDRDRWYTVETEGIYVGYRYYETRYFDAIMGQGNADGSAGVFTKTDGVAIGEDAHWNYEEEVTYSFGYGKSYTTFSQELVDFSIEGTTGTAKVRITNTGDVAGKSVAELYVSPPYTEYDKAHGIEKAAVNLIAFDKTSLLAPGEEETLTLTFDLKYVASYDSTHEKGAYLLEAGEYRFALGEDAHDAVNNVLSSLGKEVEGDAGKVRVWTNPVDDFTTFTGETVENRLSDMDINTYLDEQEQVTYLSRADWQGTFPHTEQIAISESLAILLKNDTYTRKSGESSNITWGKEGTLKLLDLKDADYDDPRWEELLDQMTLAEAIAYIGNAGEGRSRAAIPSVGLPAYARTDGPAGIVDDQATLGSWWSLGSEEEPYYIQPKTIAYYYAMNTLPMATVQAASFNPAQALAIGEMMGNDSLWANISNVQCPGLNLHRHAFNGRNHEYYSEDPMLSNILGTYQVYGMQKYGAVAVAKHVAFNDQEMNRGAVAVFMTEQRARELDLRAFEGVFCDVTTRFADAKDNVLGVMSAYNRTGATFSGAHEGLQTGILREEWGFLGYNVTDLITNCTPQYASWEESLVAGSDLLLTVTGFYSTLSTGDFTEENVKGDALLESRVREAMHRVLYTTVRSNAMNGIADTTEITVSHSSWQIALVCVDVLLGVLTAGAILWLILGLGKKEAV